jgi:3-hydroxyacyl-CoA dehydrogenase
MPGKKGYGPGGKWIHDRAKSIMQDTKDRYGDKKGKEVAYALATQQAHKLGKTPGKGQYGTKKGKSEALDKFNKSKKEYKKTASAMDYAAALRFIRSWRSK